MPFAPHVIALLEDILSDGFAYHSGLDAFVMRAGLPGSRLAAARAKAEERAKSSSRAYARAPKRYVAQEVLFSLGSGSPDDDRLLAALITAGCKVDLKGAPENARAAQESLKGVRAEERTEADEKRKVEKQRQEEAMQEKAHKIVAFAAQREKFRESFLDLTQQSDLQARGYLLETFLNLFFSFEGLNPRGSFKIIGEQIDGSFAWASHTHLVEAKWVSDPVGGAGFSGLMYKIESKSADTRGLFISINGYSPQAIAGLKMKGELRFVCIDGAHLMRALAPGGSFPKMLEVLWRHASETGEPYYPVNSMPL